MMEGLLFLVRRLFLCGLLSAFGISLVKGSSQENTMRLCCACLAVIVFFSGLPQVKSEGDWSLPQKESMEQAAQKGLEEARERQKEQICAQAGEYLSGKAQALGIACRATVVGEISSKGEFVIEKVEYFPRSPLGVWEEKELRRLAWESMGAAEAQVEIAAAEGESCGKAMDDAGIYPECR